MNHTAHGQNIALLAPLFVVLIGVISPYLISRIGGWHDLAESFRLQSEFSATKWFAQSAAMRYSMGYNNCLTVGADQAGLYVRAPFIVRLGHPPLMIPWNEISVTPVTSGWLKGRVRLLLGRNLQIPFIIRPSLAQRLQAVAGPQWPAIAL